MVEFKHLGRALLPFVPVIIGVALKFALIDQPGEDILGHFFATYLRPAWIEFLVTAYVLGLTAMLSKAETSRTDTIVFVAIPAFCFVICICLTAGTAKARIESPLLQVYIPATMAALTLALSGGRLGQSN